ncbi:MAG: hypothetical protein ACK56I_20800, partial [bacterium]
MTGGNPPSIPLPHGRDPGPGRGRGTRKHDPELASGKQFAVRRRKMCIRASIHRQLKEFQAGAEPGECRVRPALPSRTCQPSQSYAPGSRPAPFPPHR